jgi:hypothetical protein
MRFSKEQKIFIAVMIAIENLIRINRGSMLVFQSIRDFCPTIGSRLYFANRIAIEKRPAGSRLRHKSLQNAHTDPFNFSQPTCDFHFKIGSRFSFFNQSAI